VTVGTVAGTCLGKKRSEREAGHSYVCTEVNLKLRIHEALSSSVLHIFSHRNSRKRA